MLRSLRKTSLKNYTRTYDNIWKITTGQRDDRATVFLIDYPFFTEHYKMIAIDLSKQPAIDPDPRANQQINFPGNLDWAGDTTMLPLFKKQNKLIWVF